MARLRQTTRVSRCLDQTMGLTTEKKELLVMVAIDRWRE